MSGRLIGQATCLLVLNTLALSAHADHSWNNYNWAHTANPFTLMVIDSTTTDWWVELDTSLTEWSKSNVMDLWITETDNSTSSRQSCGLVAGKIRVCNAAYGSTGWLGLATIGIDSKGHIDRGAALLNDTYASYWGDQALKNHVMCQEIGHLFGLGHTSVDGSSQQTCMDYSGSQDSQWPNNHDYELLDSIYANLANYNSYDDGLDDPAGGTDPEPDPVTDPTTDPDPGTDDGGGNNKGKKGEKGGKGNGKGGRNKNSSSQLPQIPPMGIRVAGNRHEEIWVSPRRDGGLWIHHLRLVPELHDNDHAH